MDLWSVEVRNLDIVGAPQLIKKDIGEVSGLRLTDKGRYFYFLGRPGITERRIATVDGAPIKTILGVPREDSSS